MHAGCVGEMRNAYKILVGNLDGKSPFGWDIRMDHTEIGCGPDSFGSGQGPIVGCCERGNEPSGFT